MAEFQSKMRGHVPQSKFANSAKAARAANTSNRGERVEGRFDRLILTASPMWVRFSPEQLYAQLLYNKDLKAVIETGTEEYPARPWFEHKTHFVVATERPHVCSSGPRKDQPCRGCANRARYYDMLKQQEQSTQLKNTEARKNPPVQESVRFGMAVTVLEKCFEMPVIGKGGKIRTNRDGKEITNIVPSPNSGYNPQKVKEMQGEFGHNFHWAFGPVHLGHLSSIDTDLWNTCATCQSPLMATQFTCGECQGVVYEDETGISGPDLRTIRESVMKCPHCAHEGQATPIINCTGCDTPVEGSILAFDLRLRLDKDPADDKKSTVVLVDFRLPNYEKLFEKTKGLAERVYELVYSPLDIVKIFGPESLESQSFAYPDDLKKVDPSYHIEASKRRKDAAPYGGGGGTDAPADEPGDEDQMPFSG